jgi:hypothetical protein
MQQNCMSDIFSMHLELAWWPAVRVAAGHFWCHHHMLGAQHITS